MRTIALALALLAPVAAGCGMTLTAITIGVISGLDSGGGDTTVVNGPTGCILIPRVRSLTKTVDLEVTTTDPDGDPATIRIDFSLDGGTTFAPAQVTSPDASGGAPAAGVLSGLAATREGLRHPLTWAATGDLPGGAQNDVMIRASPVDAATFAPVGPPSAIVVTIGNDAPEATQFAAVDADGKVSGNVVLAFRLRDSTRDAADVAIEYSVPADGLGFRGAAIVAGATMNLPTDAGMGTLQTGDWDAAAPPPGGIGQRIATGVILRLTPRDSVPGGLTGIPVTSTVDISNNTKPGVRLDAMDPTRDANSPVPIVFTVFDDERDPVDVTVEVSVSGIDAEGVFRPATERLSGAGPRDLSDGEFDLRSETFPLGVRHRFLWDMRKDCPFATTARIRLTPQDKFSGEGVATVTPPLQVAPRFAFDLEAGQEPNTAVGLALGRFETHLNRTLVGAVSGRLGMQELPPPGTEGRPGYARRVDVHTDSPLGNGMRVAIDNVDQFRVGDLESFGPKSVTPQGVVVFASGDPSNVRVYGHYERLRGSGLPGQADIPAEGRPFLKPLATLLGFPTMDAPELVHDVAIADLDGRDGADIAAVFKHGDRTRVTIHYATTGWTAGTEVITRAPAAEGNGRVALFDVNGDDRNDVIAYFSSGASGTSSLHVALNDGTGGFLTPIAVQTRNDVFRIDGVNIDGLPGKEIVLSAVASATPGPNTPRHVIVFRLNLGGGPPTFIQPPFDVPGTFLASGDVVGDRTTEEVIFAPQAFGLGIIREDGSGGLTDEPVGVPFPIVIAAVAGDFDRDGDVDMAALATITETGSNRLQVLFNDGAGSFDEVQLFDAPAGMDALFAEDVDLDDDIDLVAPHAAASNLLRNPRPLLYAPTTFAAEDSYEWQSVTAADLDGDGTTDLVGALDNGTTGDIGVVPQLIEGTLPLTLVAGVTVSGTVSYLTAHRVGGSGFNNADGVAFRTRIGQEVAVFLLRRIAAPPPIPNPANPGEFAFTEIPGLRVLDPDIFSAVDVLNVDGAASAVTKSFDDLLVRGPTGLRLAIQTARAVFAPPVTLTADAILIVRVIDLNGDSAQDFLAVGGAETQVWQGTVGGEPVRVATVPHALGELPIDAIAADVSGDGRLDLVTYGGDTATIAVFVQGTNGVFAAPVLSVAASDPSSASISATDLDGDGRKDLVIASRERVGMLEHEPVIKTVLVRRNGAAIELVVTARAMPGHTPTRELDAGREYRFGRPVIWDFDDDGREDVAFSNDLSLVAVFPQPGGADPALRAMDEFKLRADQVFADVTGEGITDLVSPDEHLDLGALLAVEHRTAASRRIGPAGTAGERLTTTQPPIAGAAIEVAPAAFTQVRTVTILPTQPIDLPPLATGTAVPAAANAPVTPPVAFLPDRATVTQTAQLFTLTLPLSEAEELGYPDDQNGDAALVAAVRMYRFERDGNGGLGRVVENFSPTLKEVVRVDDRRVLRFHAQRLGVYQAGVPPVGP